MRDQPPIAAAVLVFVTGGVWASLFLLGPRPASTFLGLGTWVLVVVTMAGLVVARARWAVRMGHLVAWCAVPGVVVVDHPVALFAAACSVATAAVLAGPTTRRAVRLDRAADAPPDEAVALMAALVAIPLTVGLGLVGASSAPWAAWVLAVGAPVLAWWFGRVSAAALWTARLAIPVLGLVLLVLVASPWAAVPWVATAIVGWLAWRPATAIAARPLVPTSGSGKPVFAELAPAEVRAAAGVDDRGRR